MNEALSLRLRLAVRDDVPFLADCNQAMASETEDKPLDRITLEAGVRGVFDDPGRGFYLMAERSDEAVGCLLVTREWSDWRNGPFWWIQSVYVVPAARRQGVFGAMYGDIEHRAREAGAVGLRLYVELENARAQGTYESLGMRRCHYHMYESSFD